jgi:hypothetical protein
MLKLVNINIKKINLSFLTNLDRRYKKHAKLKAALDGDKIDSSRIISKVDGKETPNRSEKNKVVNKKIEERHSLDNIEQQKKTSKQKKLTTKNLDTTSNIENFEKIETKSAQSSKLREPRDSNTTLNANTPRSSGISLKSQRGNISMLIFNTEFNLSGYPTNIRTDSTSSVKTDYNEYQTNSESFESDRNWAKNSFEDLPENFIVRKSTIADGPRSTSLDGSSPFKVDHKRTVIASTPVIETSRKTFKLI